MSIKYINLSIEDLTPSDNMSISELQQIVSNGDTLNKLYNETAELRKSTKNMLEMKIKEDNKKTISRATHFNMQDVLDNIRLIKSNLIKDYNILDRSANKVISIFNSERDSEVEDITICSKSNPKEYEAMTKFLTSIEEVKADSRER